VTNDVGAQTGSILSSIVQLLIMRGRVRSRIFWRGNLLATGFTSLASVGAGYYMVNSSDPIKNYDRAFRFYPAYSRVSKANGPEFKRIVRRTVAINIPSCIRDFLRSAHSSFSVSRRSRDLKLGRRLPVSQHLDLGLGQCVMFLPKKVLRTTIL